MNGFLRLFIAFSVAVNGFLRLFILMIKSAMFFFVQLTWMRCKNPTRSNQAAIAECLKLTFLNRREFIRDQNPTMSAIFDKYPRLTDYSGEMVSLMFLHKSSDFWLDIGPVSFSVYSYKLKTLNRFSLGKL